MNKKVEYYNAKLIYKEKVIYSMVSMGNEASDKDVAASRCFTSFMQMNWCSFWVEDGASLKVEVDVIYEKTELEKVVKEFMKLDPEYARGPHLCKTWKARFKHAMEKDDANEQG